MEQIHEHVVVATSQCALTTVDGASSVAASASPPPPSSSRATALQFTVINTGFDAATFSADFRASSNIRLRFPQQVNQVLRFTQSAGGGGDNDGALREDDDASLLLFDCYVAPLERKTLVHVLKVAGKRAFVRVQFTLKHVSSPAVHRIEQAQQQNKQALAQAIKHAQSKYYANNNSLSVHRLDNTPEWIMKRCCDDINRFFRAHDRDDDARFVDTSFPPMLSSLIGHKDGDNGEKMDDTSAALSSLCSWKHLHDIMDTSWAFLTKNNRRKQQQLLPQSPAQTRGSTMVSLPTLTDFKSPLPGQDALLGALAFLSLDKEKWIKQLFEDRILKDTDSVQALAAITMRICDRGMQWKQVVVDLFQPGFPVGSAGLMSVNVPASGEIYGMIVQKAYAKLKGSYAAIGNVSTIAILRELTGLPWVSVYRSSSEQDNELNNLHKATQQKTLQRLICRRHRHRRSKNNQGGGSSSRHLFVVSFGRIGDHHHCAFPVLSRDDPEGITLQDIDNKVRKAVSSSLKPRETGNDGAGIPGDERLAVKCTWEDFFQLEPHVWMLFANHCEVRRKRIKFVHASDEDGDTTTRSAIRLQFAFSVAEMTSLVISTQLEENNKESHYHQLTLDVVEHDFSLKRIPTESTNELGSDSELQVVLALGAGEYILSVDIETKELHQSSKAPRTQDQGANLLTSLGAERNLQLLFDCIDQDMDGLISIQELESFLEMHEGAHEPLLDGTHRSTSSEAQFMDQFGSNTAEQNSSKELFVDDLRDVYHHLATALDDEDPLSELTRDKQTQRYQELIWNDLNFMLLSNQTKVIKNNQDERDDTQLSSIRVDEIEELRCCVHSDAPLVNFVQLPTPFR